MVRAGRSAAGLRTPHAEIVLTRRRARALVARRVMELGQAADYVSAGAIDELMARSNETEAGLLSALSATLFLAATEDAPTIERAHVRQAVADMEPDRGRVSTAWGRLATVLAVLTCGLAVSLGLVLVLWQPRPMFRPARPSGIAHIFDGPKRPDQASQSGAPPGLTQVTALAPVTLGPKLGGRSVTGLAPALPPVTLTETVTLPLLPAGPPPLVTLVFPAAKGARQPLWVAGLAERLQQAGLGKPLLQETGSDGSATPPMLRRSVVYFFVQDAGLARHVADLLESVDSGQSTRNLWAPLLVLSPAGTTPKPPGSIEAYIP